LVLAASLLSKSDDLVEFKVGYGLGNDAPWSLLGYDPNLYNDTSHEMYEDD